MSKSKIIKDIVEDKISLEQALNRLYILARNTKNKELAFWVEKELKGYETIEELPEYRKTTSNEIRYSGKNCMYEVTNQILPLNYIPTDIQDAAIAVNIFDGINVITQRIADANLLIKDLSDLSPLILEQSKGLVRCVSVRQIIPRSIIQSVFDEVKHRTINALIEMENTYGCLDEFDIDVSHEIKDQKEKNNSNVNKVTLNVNTEPTKEKKISKVFWLIIIPFIVGILVTVIGQFIINYWGI